MIQTKLRELKLQAQASPQKAGIFVVLCAVLAVIGGKQMLGAGPSRATAQEALAEAKEQVLGLSDLAELDTGTHVIRVPKPESGLRDLFHFDARIFPPPVQAEPETENSAKSDVRSDDPPTVSAFSSGQRAAEIRTEAERFRLRSTLLGAQPIAVIAIGGGPSGQRSEMLRIGEAIEGFELIEIQQRSVTVEKDGVRVRLNIASD